MSSVAVSCANNTFSENHFVNHALGWICSIPLLMPFEAWVLHSEAATWRMKKGNFLKTLLLSKYFWIFASLAEWARCQVSIYINKKRIIGNLALMWLGYACVLPVIIRWLGFTGFFNYFVMPWVVYLVWRSVAMRVKFKGTAWRNGLDNATMADLLSAFADEFPDTKLSAPVVGRLLFEANRRFREAGYGIKIMETLFGWESVRAFPADAAAAYDPRSPRTRPRLQRSFSTILRDDDTGLFAQFGGQAADYFDELVVAFNKKAGNGRSGPKTLVRRLIETGSAVLKTAVESEEAKKLGLHPEGLDVLAWLQVTSLPNSPLVSIYGRAMVGAYTYLHLLTHGAASIHTVALTELALLQEEDLGARPPTAYLRSCPVSYPLIGLTQLVRPIRCSILTARAGSHHVLQVERPPTLDRCVLQVNYAAALDHLGIGPEGFLPRVKGTTGHSQGVVAAVVLSRSRTVDLFLRYSGEMIEYLFWHGARMQQVANERQLTQSSSSPVAATNDLKAPATPMLSVNGLPPELIAGLLENAKLKGKVGIGLINGSTHVVLCGEPASLSTVQKSLQQPQAVDPSARSAIPFYKRRPVRLCTLKAHVDSPDAHEDKPHEVDRRVSCFRRWSRLASCRSQSRSISRAWRRPKN